MFINVCHHQLPAGGVGRPEGDAPSLLIRQHEELQLQGSSAGQQQRLWTVPAAVRRELPAGNDPASVRPRAASITV